MSDNHDVKGTSRREFLRNAAVGTAATLVVGSMPTTATAMRRVVGANNRINIGHIGVGTQGYNAHVRLLNQGSADNNTQQIAICDLYGRRLRKSQAELKLQDSQLYTNYKKLLEIKDIDAVVIATSDNWHGPISVDSLNAGKHVYVEKPLCRTIDEVFAVYDTVQKTGKKLQVGAQRCTSPKYKAVADLVKSGKYGHVVVGQATFTRNTPAGEWNNYGEFDLDAGPSATGDAHVDWDTFRKNTEPAKWDPDRYFRWRKYYEYASGLIGDLFPHHLHPLLLAMNIPMEGAQGWPRRVSSGGGLYVQKFVDPERFSDADAKKKEMDYLAKYHPGQKLVMDREVPDFVNMNVDFDDCSLMMMASSINEEGWPTTIRMNKATINFGSNKIVAKPERVYSEDVDDYSAEAPGEDDNIPGHQKNWFDSIRNNTQPSANIEVAARAQVAVTLAEMSNRQSKTFLFDPKTRKVTN